MKPTAVILVCALLLVTGCAQFTPSAVLQPPPTIRAAAADRDEQLPQPREMPRAPAVVVTDPARPAPKVLPISLDTVFRLANNQNGEITLAREKVHEAAVKYDLARKAWVPDLYLSTTYFRHEGGTQDFTGQFIRSSYGSWLAGLELNGRVDLVEAAFQKVDAERKVWQKRGELSKISSETLLDAATTYIDWLTALEGLRVADDIERRIKELLARAEKRASVDKSAHVEVSRINAELRSQKLIGRKLHESAISAEAKIKYLLGLDPGGALVPIDKGLLPIKLVDANLPPEQLVERAWSRGPGVAELTGLLDLIERNAAKSGNALLMPVLEVNLGEGAFAAGPGSSLDVDNRLDFCVRLRWNLKKYCLAEEGRRLIESQRTQAHLGYANLRSKLALGVQEGREASLSSEERTNLAVEQVDYAEDTYALGKNRLENAVPGASYAEVLLSLRSLAAAHFSRVEALRDFDRAQLRLFVLLGDAAVQH